MLFNPIHFIGERNMACWLVKSEPEVYSWDTFVMEGRTFWSGVRNAQARNNLQAMKLGEPVLFYHSQEGKAIVGIAEVAREAYPDPTSPEDPRWVVVDLVPVRKLNCPVSLAMFRADPILQDAALVRQSRLSVMPLSPEQYARVLELAK